MSDVKQPQDRKKPQGKTEEAPKVTHKTVTINGVEYPTPQIGLLDRAATRKLQPLIDRVTSSQSPDLDDLWELADVLLTETPTEDVDKLRIDDVKALLSAAGVIAFTGIDAPNPDNLTITLGESLASTDS